MNFYSFQGINGCLTLIIILFIMIILFKLFAGLIIVTLPFWVILGFVFLVRKIYLNYSNSKSNSSVKNNVDEQPINSKEKNKVSREADDVEFHEYKD